MGHFRGLCANDGVSRFSWPSEGWSVAFVAGDAALPGARPGRGAGAGLPRPFGPTGGCLLCGPAGTRPQEEEDAGEGRGRWWGQGWGEARGRAPAQMLSLGEKCVSWQHQPISFPCFVTKSPSREIPALCLQSQGPGRLVHLVGVERAPCSFPGSLGGSQGAT